MMLIDCRIGIIKYPHCTNQQDNSSFILTSSRQHQAPQVLSPPATTTQSPLLLLANCCPPSEWDKSRLFQADTQLLFKICCRQLIIGICLQTSAINVFRSCLSSINIVNIQNQNLRILTNVCSRSCLANCLENL